MVLDQQGEPPKPKKPKNPGCPRNNDLKPKCASIKKLPSRVLERKITGIKAQRDSEAKWIFKPNDWNKIGLKGTAIKTKIETYLSKRQTAADDMEAVKKELENLVTKKPNAVSEFLAETQAEDFNTMKDNLQMIGEGLGKDLASDLKDLSQIGGTDNNLNLPSFDGLEQILALAEQAVGAAKMLQEERLKQAEANKESIESINRRFIIARDGDGTTTNLGVVELLLNLCENHLENCEKEGEVPPARLEQWDRGVIGATGTMMC